MLRSILQAGIGREARSLDGPDDRRSPGAPPCTPRPRNEHRRASRAGATARQRRRHGRRSRSSCPTNGPAERSSRRWPAFTRRQRRRGGEDRRRRPFLDQRLGAGEQWRIPALDVLLNDRKPVTQLHDLSGRDEADGNPVAYSRRVFRSPMPCRCRRRHCRTPSRWRFPPIGATRRSIRFFSVIARCRPSRGMHLSRRPHAAPQRDERDAADQVLGDRGERRSGGKVVGGMCPRSAPDKIQRPIVEGTELELTIKIDTSRKLSVEVFVPTAQRIVCPRCVHPRSADARGSCNFSSSWNLPRECGARPTSDPRKRTR